VPQKRSTPNLARANAIERKEVFLAYRFALQYYRSRVSSRSELLSTPVTKFGDPHGAPSSFSISPSCIPYSAPRGDLAAPVLLCLWAEPFLMIWSCFFTVDLPCLWCLLLWCLFPTEVVRSQRVRVLCFLGFGVNFFAIGGSLFSWLLSDSDAVSESLLLHDSFVVRCRSRVRCFESACPLALLRVLPANAWIAMLILCLPISLLSLSLSLLLLVLVSSSTSDSVGLVASCTSDGIGASTVAACAVGGGRVGAQARIGRWSLMSLLLLAVAAAKSSMQVPRVLDVEATHARMMDTECCSLDSNGISRSW
jgi:hypothetical protein